MTLFKKYSNPTPRQFYFPYFMNKKEFDTTISKFNLSTKVKFDEKLQMASELTFLNKKGLNKTIKFHSQFSFTNEFLLIWSIENDTLEIEKINLNSDLKSETLSVCIPNLKIGLNIIENNLNLSNFVTFARSERIKYELDYFDNFLIIIISNNQIELIPFDWFNEKGGDYGYVWPALARINSEGYLIGKGMRMDDFKIKIKNSP